MMYRNDSYAAVLATERMRTGHYGEDGYIDTDEICPVCDAENPDRFYYSDKDKICVGCTDCIEEVDVNLYVKCPVCGSTHQDGFYENESGECVGCTSCVSKKRFLDGEDW